MQVLKGDLVTGAYTILRISGLTAEPSPSDVVAGLQEADDLAAEIEGDRKTRMNINWQYPDDYGQSDPADISGLPPAIAGSFKSALCIRLLDLFGKAATPSLAERANAGMRAIEHYAIKKPVACMPSTLPIGSGNQDFHSWDRQFYPEPPASGEQVFKGDKVTASYDFSEWLIDEVLDSVTWEVARESSNVIISNDSFTDTVAQGQLEFTQLDRASVIITATKTNSTDIKKVVLDYVINDPNRTGYKYT